MSLQHIPTQNASGLVHEPCRCGAERWETKPVMAGETGIGKDSFSKGPPMKRLSEAATDKPYLEARLAHFTLG